MCDGKNEFQCFHIVSNSNVVIPSWSEIIIKGLVCGPKPAKDCVIEACKQKIPDVLVGKVLATVDNGYVPVRVLNVSDKPRKVKKGVYLAQGEPVLNGEIIHEDSETFIDSEGNLSKQTMPDHLRDLFERSVSVIQSEEEKDLVRNFLCEYADIFSTSDTGRTGVIKHDIFTGDHQPVKLPAR